MVKKILAIVLLLIMLSACAAAYTAPPSVDFDSHTFRREDFVGKRIGISTSSAHDRIVDDYIGEAKKYYFNSGLEAEAALMSDMIDAIVYAELDARGFVSLHPELVVLYPALKEKPYGVVFNRNNTVLRDKFNIFLNEIKENGILEDMTQRWTASPSLPPMPEIPSNTNGGILTFATTCENSPFAYIKDGILTGFEIELATRFAAYMGKTLDISLASSNAVFSEIQSGKIDFACNAVSISDERAEFFGFSEPYYIEHAVVVAKRADAYGSGTNSPGSFWSNAQNSFSKNFIVEGRWKLALDGLRVTLAISVSSMIFGTLLGFLLCFMSLSRVKALNIIAQIYTALLRGTPIVVLLMIIFYVIFAKASVSSVTVAIVAFGLNTGAFLGTAFRSAVVTVDKGQVEAARSTGFSDAGAFFLVTLPQASRMALPFYKSAFVSLVKSTAIVGYIAIVDLTKAVDIIRSRTYDAFFPLLAVTAVYFLVTGAFLWVFGLIEKLTDKRGRRKNV